MTHWIQRLFESVPLSRLFVYALFLFSLPIVLFLFHFVQQKNALSHLHHQVQFLREKAFLKEQREANNWSTYFHFSNADHFFIDRHLESISLLEREVADLEQIIEDKNFANDSRINARLQQLQNGANSLSFVEGVVQTHPLFQETTETLARPVEVDIHDIQKLLSRIEGVSVGKEEVLPNAPQLLITDWKMERKMINPQHEVFTLYFKCIKREFL